MFIALMITCFVGFFGSVIISLVSQKEYIAKICWLTIMASSLIFIVGFGKQLNNWRVEERTRWAAEQKRFEDTCVLEGGINIKSISGFLFCVPKEEIDKIRGR